MVEIYQKIHALAAKEFSILLVGETGVGKEMLARTLHLSSPRAEGPFVPVNCAAIPADLAEAELFGIGEKVATGVAGRTGKFVSANGGTLLLDELGALPADIQAKLLRAVEDKKIFQVGRPAGQAVDFRIISATNQDPRELIRSGKLREDLYHRLATVELFIPPLRDRHGDLAFLVLGLLNGLSSSEKKPLGGISRLLLSNLCRRDWPGNVRELCNLLKALVAAAHPGEILDVRLLPAEPIPISPATDDLHAVLDETARQRIEEALRLHDGNITRAAKHMNLSTVGLRKMMKRLGITKDGM
jgi:transcriptional regulator with PAS, ATPase and Fis domain